MSEPIVSDKKFCERLRRQADDGHHWDRAPAMLRESAERIERLAGNLRDCREVLRSTDEALQDSACEIERLTRERDAALRSNPCPS